MGRQTRRTGSTKVAISCFRAFENIHRVPVEAHVGQGCGRIAMLHSGVNEQMGLKAAFEITVLASQLINEFARQITVLGNIEGSCGAK